MTVIDDFFKDLPENDKRDADIFERPEEKASAKEAPISEEETGKEGRKNRRERRRDERDLRKDQMIEELNDRIIELSRNTPELSKTNHDIPTEWIALYGDTPEARKAWDINSTLINRAKEEAAESALNQFRNEQIESVKEQQKFEELIDSELESLEDEHDVDLTSNAPAARKARREFLELIQELSPKDEDGTIMGYADFDRTFEIYQNSRKTDKSELTDRKKELSSRSMNKGSGSGTVEVTEGPMTFEAARKAIGGLLNR